MVNEPTSIGDLIDVHPIGVFYMVDEKGEDEKIISVPSRDPFCSSTQDIYDVPRHFTIEVDHFFSIYKELERKRVKTSGNKGVEEAEKVIVNGYGLNNKKKESGF